MVFRHARGLLDSINIGLALLRDAHDLHSFQAKTDLRTMACAAERLLEPAQQALS
jgi:hypothetical protein